MQLPSEPGFYWVLLDGPRVLGRAEWLPAEVYALSHGQLVFCSLWTDWSRCVDAEEVIAWGPKLLPAPPPPEPPK